MLKNLPNTLTILRIIMIPFFVLFFFIPSSWSNFVAAAIFVLAALTDLLDGYLARKLQVCSKFGAFLDPVADKIMVCTALVLLVNYFSVMEKVGVYNYLPGLHLVVTICAIVIISREIVISALREWMAEIGNRAKVAVSWIGKWKTAIQMIGITGLIWRDDSLHSYIPNWMVYASIVVLMVATMLTIWSMVSYLRAGLGSMITAKSKEV